MTLRSRSPHIPYQQFTLVYFFARVKWSKHFSLKISHVGALVDRSHPVQMCLIKQFSSLLSILFSLFHLPFISFFPQPLPLSCYLSPPPPSFARFPPLISLLIATSSLHHRSWELINCWRGDRWRHYVLMILVRCVTLLCSYCVYVCFSVCMCVCSAC